MVHAVFGMLFLIVPAFSFGQELSLDTGNITVSFVFEADNVEGTVGGVEATIVFNPTDLENASIAGSAQVSTLNTGNKMRDKHLKSEEYFDVENFPEMTFTSTAFKSQEGSYLAEGNMSITSVTQKVVFEITITDASMILKTRINAHHFNVSPRKEAKSMVSVSITIPMK